MMKIRYRALSISFLLSCLLYGAHVYASSNALYFEFFWFSALMHFLGGAILGILWMWFIGRAGWKHSLGLLILFVGSIGIGWEIFEFVFDIAYAGKYYVIDTTVDLIMDVLGAVMIYLLFKKKFIVYHE